MTSLQTTFKGTIVNRFAAKGGFYLPRLKGYFEVAFRTWFESDLSDTTSGNCIGFRCHRAGYRL